MESTLTNDQMMIFAIIAGSIGLFIWNRWRYDLVALAALFASVVAGVVPAKEAFTGLSDPVVITVATILVISAAVSRSGFIDICLKLLSGVAARKNIQIVVLVGMVMTLSAFMNNVGALAVFLPITMAFARKAGRSPSELLMPLSFGSLLGGLVTLIGTPPNLLISAIREDITGEPYHMFDFAPVGLGMCVVGVIYLALAWRLIPKERRGAVSAEEQFTIEDYISEVIVGEESPWIDQTINEIEASIEGDFTIVGVSHAQQSTLVPAGRTKISLGDILLIETDPITLKEIVDKAKIKLAGSKEIKGLKLTSDEVGVVEAVLIAESVMVRTTPKRLKLRSRCGVNLLAVRQAERAGSGMGWARRLLQVPATQPQRLSDRMLQEGDVVVLQGRLDAIPETLADLGCLPLAERNLQLGRNRMALLPVLILGACIALTVTGALPISIAFLGGVLAIGLLRILRLNEMYSAIDAPVIVLLAAMIPVSDALRTTGGTEVIAAFVAELTMGLAPPVMLGTVIVATMLVTPFLNNAATVLLMAPVAAGIALKLDYAVDPFLMGVAIGASCDFLTPIGHQSNTLVMAPGGYKFTDYWRLGLPLSMLVVLVSVPLILWVWPL